MKSSIIDKCLLPWYSIHNNFTHRVFHWGFSSFDIYLPIGSYSSIFFPQWVTNYACFHNSALWILWRSYSLRIHVYQLAEVFCLNNILGVTHVVNNWIRIDTYHIKKNPKPNKQKPPISEVWLIFPHLLPRYKHVKETWPCPKTTFFFFFFPPWISQPINLSFLFLFSIFSYTT